MKSRLKIALTRRLPGNVQERLAELYDVKCVEKGGPVSREELKSILADSDVIICQLTDKMDRSVLSSKIRCLITFSVGLDHLNLEDIFKLGIRVSHTPHVLTEATADLTWALILSASRSIVPAAEYLKRGQFNGFSPRLFLGRGLSGKTLGILGMGRIGEAVARRAVGFGMPVIYHSRSERKKTPGTPVEFEALLAQSDVLSIHCPLNNSTHHLMGREALRTMKEDALLVNTARGPIIDEVALVIHLRERPRFMAALDVYEREPELEPGLASAPNALCLPHIGSAVESTRLQMAEVCVEEAIRFANGEPLMYEVGGSHGTP